MTGYYIVAVRGQGTPEETQAFLLGPLLTLEEATDRMDQASVAYAYENPVEAMFGLDRFHTAHITTDNPFPVGQYNWIFEDLKIDPSFILETIES